MLDRDKLCDKGHWDLVHADERNVLFGSLAPKEAEPGRLSLRDRARRGLKGLLGDAFLERMKSYDEYLRQDVILPRYLPNLQGAKVIEIGSAPGEHVAQFSRRYRCVPYGVEYSETGVEVNRRVFGAYGFDPDNVIHADFFSDEFRGRFRNRFDVVISRGFIEHFADVQFVIDRHIDLLVPGGCLIVSVPNLRGFNYAVARLLHKEVIALHNLEIMRKESFSRLFERRDMDGLFCEYYGTFSFYLFTAASSMKRRMLRVAFKLQPLLNVAFRAAFGQNGSESAAFSPHILYVGKKL